ncbi:MAG TPA: hypothetical protein VI854_08285 [Acidimicrobiia bacterium]|nr:hypothetical protein [Acidimicrobiia bacterium]
MAEVIREGEFEVGEFKDELEAARGGNRQVGTKVLFETSGSGCGRCASSPASAAPSTSTTGPTSGPSWTAASGSSAPPDHAGPSRRREKLPE